jgi:hypothetical protein
VAQSRLSSVGSPRSQSGTSEQRSKVELHYDHDLASLRNVAGHIKSESPIVSSELSTEADAQ